MMTIGDPPPCSQCGLIGLGPARYVDPTSLVEFTHTVDANVVARLEALEEQVKRLETKQAHRKPSRVSRLSSGGPMRRSWSGC